MPPDGESDAVWRFRLHPCVLHSDAEQALTCNPSRVSSAIRNILYVRQSSPYHVILESQKLQYGMEERLHQLGWHEMASTSENDFECFADQGAWLSMPPSCVCRLAFVSVSKAELHRKLDLPGIAGCGQEPKA